MVCKKCGREFEGTFCPNCGERVGAEQNVCPVCGTPHAAGDAFCPKCGYSFRAGGAEKAVPAQPAVRSEVKAYRAMGLASGWMFVLYAVLMLIFMATPVAAATIGKGSSFGNVYALGGVVTGLRGACIAAIIFAVLAVLVAAVVALYQLTASGKSGFSPLYMPLALSACVFYIIQFIIACAMLGIVGGVDGGVGLIKAGAYPVLALIFSILWLIVGVALLVLRALLAKRDASVKQTAEADRDARAAEAERLHAENAVPQAAAPRGYREINRLARFDRFSRFFLFGIILPMLLVLLCMLPSIQSESMTDKQYTAVYWAVTLMCWVIGAAIFFAFFFGKPKHKIGASLCCGKRNGILWGLFPLLVAVVWFVAIVGSSFAIDNLTTDAFTVFISCIFVPLILIIIEAFVIWIGRRKLRNSVKLAVYGTLHPAGNAAPLTPFADYQTESRAYAAYTAWASGATFVSTVRNRSAVMACAVVLAAVLGVSILIPGLAPERRLPFTEAVRKIELGTSKEEVLELLGEPNGDYANKESDFYEYYDALYLELKEMTAGGGASEDFDDSDIEDWGDLEDAFEDALEDAESSLSDGDKLGQFAHMYTQIRFNEEDEVTSIVCDTAYRDSAPEAATKKGTATLVETSGYRRYAFNEVYYKAVYDDGSYVIERADSAFLPLESRQTFEWKDRYGNTFSAEVSASGGISGEDLAFDSEYASKNSVQSFFSAALNTLIALRSEGVYSRSDITEAMFAIADEGIISSEYPLTVAFTFQKGSFSGARVYEIWFNDAITAYDLVQGLSYSSDHARHMGVREVSLTGEEGKDYDVSGAWDEKLENELRAAAGLQPPPQEALVKELSQTEDGRRRYEYFALAYEGITIYTLTETAAEADAWTVELTVPLVAFENAIRLTK